MWFTPAHREELLLRWRGLGEHFRRSGPDWDNEGARLIRSWSRWPRKYHNTVHLMACLRHFSEARTAFADPDAAELALWFHDAIYWPWRPLNEEKSADWASRFMHRMDLNAATQSQVRQHILDTRHQAVPLDPDAMLVVDIDLAILGQSDEIYRRFERDVRSEYRWVRWSRYVKGRSAVLQSFLERPRIYSTSQFSERFEARARVNLQNAIHALSKGKLHA
jgi:predicted metal-dependent HD superfamily phosphohydrolase